MVNGRRQAPKIAVQLLFLLGAGLMGSCAQTPDKPGDGIAQARLKMQAQGAALVTDGCVSRVSDVADHYLIDESRRLAAQAAEGAGVLLQDQHVSIKGVQVPFVCGSLAINPLADARVAEGVEQTVRHASLPMVLNDTLARDAALVEAYRRLLYAARADPTTLHGELFTAEQAALLKQKLGAPSVLVVMIWGQSVSAGATLGKKVGCVLMSLLGCGSVYQPDLDKSKALASVIDLDARSVVWTDVMRFQSDEASLLFGGADPAHADNYTGMQWLQDLTHDFFHG